MIVVRRKGYSNPPPRMGARSGFVCCSRILSFILNLAMLITGLLIIALSLWIWLDDRFESELRDDIKYKNDPNPLRDTKESIRTWITVSFWVLIGFGAAATILGLLGLCGAATHSRALVGLYLPTFIVMILLEIAVGAVVLAYRGTIRDEVHNYVNETYQLYPGESSGTHAFENRYMCCGADAIRPDRCNLTRDESCTTAVWHRLSLTLMIAGFILLGIIVLQTVTVAISLVLVWRRRTVSVD